MQFQRVLCVVFVHIVYLNHSIGQGSYWAGGVSKSGCKHLNHCVKCKGSTCTQCAGNRKLPKCKECLDGRWGRTCKSRCGKCKRNPVCVQLTGSCVTGECQGNYKLSKCTDCKGGFWGKTCANKCGNCNGTLPCNSKSGNCMTGKCNGNYKLKRCADCLDGFWSKNCSLICGQCKNNLPCNPTSGECAMCQVDYQMPKCQTCIDGKYGSSCEKHCNCYQNYDCDKTTGSCRHYGCALFYSGVNTCNTKNECPIGKFGTKCVSCGKCKLSCKRNKEMCFPDCNRTTGECEPRQCMAYFTGRRCDSCVKLRYGLNCQYKCGQCLKDMCNGVTGLCLEGCKRGYTGNKCDMPCKAGLYGCNCARKCGKCAGNVPCDRSTGECPDRKCDRGVEGNNCDQVESSALVCPIGLFGEKCNQNCGNCAKGAVCNSADGTCPDGCLDRYEAPFCFTCSKGYFGKSCEETCGHCKNKEICDGFSGACPQGCADGFTGHYCKKRVGQLKRIGDDFSEYFDIDNF